MGRTLGTKAEQEARRVAAGRLLLAGSKSIDVACALNVATSSVGRWKAIVQCQGLEGLRTKSPTGRPPKLPKARLKTLTRILLKGALAAGFSSDLWTGETRRSSHSPKIQRRLPSPSCAEDPPATDPNTAKTAASSTTTRPRRTERWRNVEWPRIKKGRPVASADSVLDESGFLLQPTVRRTWAPSGRTPILVESARRDRLSAIGAFSISPLRRRMDFFFQLHGRNIDTSLLIAFLRSLHHRFRRRLVLVWDNLPAHFKTAKYFAIKHPSWFRFEPLPSYCPELNPVEGVWSYVKHGCQANFAPDRRPPSPPTNHPFPVVSPPQSESLAPFPRTHKNSCSNGLTTSATVNKRSTPRLVPVVLKVFSR